jgi:hypothetical protein
MSNQLKTVQFSDATFSGKIKKGGNKVKNVTKKNTTEVIKQRIILVPFFGRFHFHSQF